MVVRVGRGEGNGGREDKGERKIKRIKERGGWERMGGGKRKGVGYQDSPHIP